MCNWGISEWWSINRSGSMEAWQTQRQSIVIPNKSDVLWGFRITLTAKEYDWFNRIIILFLWHLSCFFPCTCLPNWLYQAVIQRVADKGLYRFYPPPPLIIHQDKTRKTIKIFRNAFRDYSEFCIGFRMSWLLGIWFRVIYCNQYTKVRLGYKMVGKLPFSNTKSAQNG